MVSCIIISDRSQRPRQRTQHVSETSIAIAQINQPYENIIANNAGKVRYQASRLSNLYTKREKTVSQIPNFWPLVLEQAPPDIDQYIQPSDSALLLSALTNLSVSHFEIPSSSSKTQQGDPRSVSIKFEFSPNEYFEDKILEKKFWYRRSKDGWSGLVSEPVKIRWKKDRDLTGGLLDMVCAAYSVSQTSLSKTGLTPEQKALKKKIDNTGMGGLSFFAWFGFIGRRISAEESRQANRIEREKRQARFEKKNALEELSDEEEDEDDVGMSLEIFPDGDDLAVAITEDLWPSAIKYFSESPLPFR